VYGGLKVQGKEAHSLTQQRIVVLGAGSAGMGVSTMMAQGMVKHVSTYMAQACTRCLVTCSAVYRMSCAAGKQDGWHGLLWMSAP